MCSSQRLPDFPAEAGCKTFSEPARYHIDDELAPHNTDLLRTDTERGLLHTDAVRGLLHIFDSLPLTHAEHDLATDSELCCQTLLNET